MDFDRPFALAAQNTHFPPSKTPGRALKGRAKLQENLIQNGSATVNVRGKKAAPGTPFRQENRLRPLKLVESSATKVLNVASRPLADKTPAPNRHNATQFATPLLQKGKQGKISALTFGDAKETLQTPAAPSSTRKKLRFPRSASKSFETPITNGDHWNVSDVSINLGENGLGEVIEKDDEPDYEELEYMPPKATELPYEPDIELPDYKILGKALIEAAYSYPIDDAPVEYNFDPDPDEMLKNAGWSATSGAEDLNIPEELEDVDHFALLKRPKVIARQVRSRTVAGPSRPLLSSSRAAPSAPNSNAAFHSKAIDQTSSAIRRNVFTRAPAAHSKTASTASSTTTFTRRIAISSTTVAARTSRTPSTVTKRPVSEMAPPRPAVRAPLAARSKSSASAAPGTRIRLPVKPTPAEEMIINFSNIDLAINVIDDFRFEI